jgi:peptide/nickel transport system permease protein
MWRYLARTVAQRLLLLIVISMVSHAVIHLAPGEPSQVDPMNPMMKAADIARIRQSFHLDDPLYLQYVHWLRDLLTGELKSFRDGSPVVPRIWGRFLNSLPLFLCTTLIVWTASFPTGIQAALRRGSVYDRSTTLIAYTLISIPGFFLAYLLILGVVRIFHLPVIGLHTFGTEHANGLRRAMDRLWHLVIPSVMAALTGIAVLSRYVRSQMLEVLEQDYVRTARAKGLSEERVVYGHALRNALLPFVTLFGFLLPGLISGSVIFEQIFAWPGLGLLGYEAILSRDFPMILTLNFMAAALTLFGILVSDILYALVDPRIRLE